VNARIIADGSFHIPRASRMTITPTRFRQLLVLYVLCSVAVIVAGFVPGGYSNDLALQGEA
jgi:hypothetical protein